MSGELNKKLTTCDVCGEKLTMEENEVYQEISNDVVPCYCSIAKEIYWLRKKYRKQRKGIRASRDLLLKEVRGSFWTKPEIRQMIKNVFDKLEGKK